MREFSMRQTNRRIDNTFRSARTLRPNRVLQNSLGDKDRVDFYKFTASNQVDVSLKLRGLQANANLRLFNSRRRPIRASRQPAKQAELIVATLNPGTYFLEVQMVGCKKNTPYKLRTSVALAEPGESTSTARNLGFLSQTFQIREFVNTNDPLDYYKFTLPQISNFTASIDGLPQTALMDLYYDANNNGRIDDGERLDGGQDGTVINRTMLPGAYFLDVKTAKDASTRYDLFFSATPNPSNLLTDPGNAASVAFDLGAFPNTTAKDFVGAFDSVDFYKFILPEISDFTANIDGLSETVLMDLYYDANNNGAIDDDERLDSGRDGTAISRTMLPGTYFLEVNTFGNSSTRYDLFLSTTPNPSNLPVDPGNLVDRSYDLGNFVGIQSLKDFVGSFDRLDYYKFSVDTARTLNASVDGLSQTALIDLFFDANGDGAVDMSERLERGRDSSNIARTLEAGSYLLRVSTFSSSSTRYDLNLEIS